MKKAVLFLIILLFAPDVTAAPRIISTSRPPYNRGVNPFIRHPHRYYRPYNSYFGRNFIRPYYGNSFGRIYNRTYYPVYYGTNTYSTYRPYEEYEVQNSTSNTTNVSTEEKHALN